MRIRSRRTAALATTVMFSAAASWASTARAVTPTGAADSAPAVAHPATGAGPTTTYRLPTGDIVTVHGSGRSADYTVTGPDGSSVSIIRYDVADGHAYLLPASLIADAGSFDISAFDVPALAAAPTPVRPSATPHYAMSILQVNATDLTGAPAASAVTLLTNVDSLQRWGSPISVVDGVARVAVPAGHYAAYTIFVEEQGGGPIGTKVDLTHVVVQSGLTVATGGVTTLAADERTASSQVSGATPRPSTTSATYAGFTRTDATGQAGRVDVAGIGPLWLNAQPKPQLGTLGYQVVWAGGDPYGSDPYYYTLMYPPVDHIDADQTWPVDPAKLAVQHNRFDTDPANAGSRGSFTLRFVTADGFAVGPGLYPTNPNRLTVYASALQPGAQWLEAYYSTATSASRLADLWLAVRLDPGTTTSRSWLHGPLTPQIGRAHGAAVCGACTDGSTLAFSFASLVDSEPDSFILPFGRTSSHFTLYRDGVQVFDQDGVIGGQVPGVSEEPGRYRAVFDQDLSSFGLSQSTATHTDVTFPYRPGADPALPAQDICPVQGPAASPCRILPVLNLGYNLRTDSANASGKPLQKLELTVGHQSFDGVGSHAAATGATVSVSFDGGRTWTAAHTVRTGGDRFEAQWKNTAPQGTTPWLKVTATDAVGGSISQTIDNAYTIG
ncbi:MAG: hypothetical protein HOV87_24500 [Catenulispora sp.]|nr:hypothetical protein [Catenulispora sp.]